MITGQDLINRGFIPGPKFKDILAEVNDPFLTEQLVEEILVRHLAEQEQAERIKAEQIMPMRPHENEVPIHVNIEAESELEEENVAGVLKAVKEIVRTPTVTAVSVMPDACPTGPRSVPVGTVVAARNAIHPGWHSPDVCCSMFATNFGGADPKEILDLACEVTHFGPGGRTEEKMVFLTAAVRTLFENDNPFLQNEQLQIKARSHFATQGDGNHFLFVGKSERTGEVWLVTHHGSRGVGAELYKAGMAVAEEYRKKLCPYLPKQNAWIPYDTADGKAYWQALQYVRIWTKFNHWKIHNMVLDGLWRDRMSIIHAQFWNEHNFVFLDIKRNKAEAPIFYHAKGATPIHDGFLQREEEDNHPQIIPLNMTEPILFVRGTRTETNLGFAPHGAGRNISRSAHRRSKAGRTDEEILEEETDGLDVRFYNGNPDITELPSAYKNALSVQRQMDKFGLAEVVDRIIPYGCMMAGAYERKRRKKQRRKIEFPIIRNETALENMREAIKRLPEDKRNQALELAVDALLGISDGFEELNKYLQTHIRR